MDLDLTWSILRNKGNYYQKQGDIKMYYATAAHRPDLHEGLTRNNARIEYGHSPDPFWWPRKYYQGGRRKGEEVLTTKELPQFEPETLDDLEVLGEMLLEYAEEANDMSEFDNLVHNIKEL
jgi:hypothetical protein